MQINQSFKLISGIGSDHYGLYSRRVYIQKKQLHILNNN
jgi:hypothetical protein